MSHSTHGRVKVAGVQPAQVLAGLLGLVFLVVGVLGFLRTGFGDFAGEQHAMLFGFAVNPLHNVVHLAFGVLGLLMATRSGLSRLYGWLVFLAYGAVLVWGLMLVGLVSVNPVERLGNPLAINANDNWLHLGLTAAGLLTAVLPARRKVVVDEPEVYDHHRAPEPVREESIRDEHGHPVPEPRVESMDPTVTTRPIDTRHDVHGGVRGDLQDQTRHAEDAASRARHAR
ncbi:hypothetical protein JOF41_004153 [Saccharothrix coeruleofusca]|uniref:DUF4383 domain-containing protein n=1 Tax=Saccharothrix coeruleofusca TaxID=33919 RepID=UPI001AE89BCD|nr:DUF4383 domain-containing protein [Saccharothrix coeruleofusca]MBP2337975.1 hypothetical protein [Saccharothrix coeruleofusca]